MATEALPLAIPMVVGPALVAALILASDPRSIRSSLAYALGIGASTVLGTAIAIGLVALVEIEVGDSSDAGSAGTIIQLILAGVLIAITLRRRLRSRVARPPAWLEAQTGRAGPSTDQYVLPQEFTCSGGCARKPDDLGSGHES